MNAKSIAAPIPSATMVYIFVGVFVTVMTLHPYFANINLDRHGDMVENYAWGMTWQWGYYKHPPLFAWITAAWFELFPKTHFFYYLLSSINAGVGLLLIWHIARRYLSSNGAFLAICIAVCMPPLYFLAIIYNANSAMIPLWAAIFLYYLRIIEKPTLLNGALLGLYSGLAMLTKYYSVMIIAPLLVHALMEPDLRPLLIKPVFVVALAIGAITITPHIIWLVNNDFLPLSYAASQGSYNPLALLKNAAIFPIALLLYALPGYLVLLFMWRKEDDAIYNLLGPARDLPGSQSGRALLYALIGGLVLTYMLAFASGAYLIGLWALPLFFIAPLILALQIPRDIASHRWRSGFMATCLFLVISLLATPFLHRLNLSRAISNNLLPLNSIALEAQKIWQSKSTSPLVYVAGTQVIANAISFYVDTPVSAMQDMSLRATPFMSMEKIKEKGLMVLCIDSDQACIAKQKNILPRTDFTTSLIVESFEGAAGPSTYRIFVYGMLPDGH